MPEGDFGRRRSATRGCQNDDDRNHGWAEREFSEAIFWSSKWGPLYGEPHAVGRDVKQAPEPVVLFLHAPPRPVPLDGNGPGLVEVVPVPEEHRLDLLGQRAIRVFPFPEVVPQGVQVEFLGRPLPGRHDEPELVAQGLQVGERLGHGVLLGGECLSVT